MKQLKQAGFSMVEMAVVMIIIGLLTSIVLVGQDMLEKSKGKAMLGEMQNLLQALAAFQEKYYYRPGDLVQSSRYFTGDAATDGNGNSRIDTWQERNVMWPQLFQADFIQHNLSVTGAAADRRIIGEHRPPSNVDSAGWTWLDNYAMDQAPLTGTYNFYDVLRLGGMPNSPGADGGEFFENPVITLGNHRYVDTKVDSENTPISGKITVAEEACIRDDGSGNFLYATDESLLCTVNYVQEIVTP